MTIEKGVPLPVTNSHAKYQFDGIEHGDSMWIESHEQRAAMMTYFRRWLEKTGERYRAVSRRVDETDPRGTGYRVWFIRDDEAILKSSARFTMPSYDELPSHLRDLWARKFIENEDDYMEMLRMLPAVPKNQAQLKQMKIEVNNKRTAFQVKCQAEADEYNRMVQEAEEDE